VHCGVRMTKDMAKRGQASSCKSHAPALRLCEVAEVLQALLPLLLHAALFTARHLALDVAAIVFTAKGTNACATTTTRAIANRLIPLLIVLQRTERS
jgi:hypothetical protein